MTDPSSTGLPGSFKLPQAGQSSPLVDKIKKIREAYRAKLPDKISEMQRTVRAAETGGWTIGLLEKLYQSAHKLHGSAATFGFSKISGVASILEQRCKTLLAQDSSPVGDDMEAMSGWIQDLQREAANSPGE